MRVLNLSSFQPNFTDPLAQETLSKTSISSYLQQTNQAPLPQPHIPVQADIDKSFLFDPTTQPSSQCISNHSIFSHQEACSFPHREEEPQFWNKFQTPSSLDGLDVLASSRPDFIDTDSLSAMVACTPDFDTKSILVVPNSTNTISITTPPLICDPSCLTPESLLTATPLVAVGSVQNVAPDLPRVPDNTPVDALALGSVPNYNLDSFDSHFIDKLLNSSLVDSAVEDPSNWESLFPDSNKAVATTSAISPLSRPLSTVSELVTDVLPTTITEEMVLSPVTHPVFETKFVHEKRSAMVLAGKEKKNEEDDDDEEDDEDLERRSKKRHISALEFEELASISLDSGSSPSKELPPIVVDPSDRRAVKRARNTMAARRSREKKKMEMDDLRQKVSDQERVIMKLEAQVNLLRTLLNQK